MDANNFRRSMLDRLASETHVTKLHAWFRLTSFPFEAVLPLVPKEGAIYDVGCGFGLFSYLLAKDSSKRRVIAYDPSLEKTRVARVLLAGLDNVTVFRPTDHFPRSRLRPKVVVILDVLYLLSPRKKRFLVRSIFSRLQRSGTVIIAIVPKEPSWRYVLSFLQELLVVKCLQWTTSRMNIINFETEEFLRRILSDCGFVAIQRHRLTAPFPFFHRHTLFVAKKL
ncbi:MAG: hypothetical protein A2900_01285 [Candidatus Chisholmbacteria bacterium RIFCSPLOWO2_01_FULL_50_28]|uniref:Methyltransferase domain-containing protein n=1 Tax=Candidatus Chisholmbacteria bacterium RIFCSPHIGHO2_01_FULL_52_32 TaxID=1797591 RepID=A0A1G1VUM4_9BACT|nr:MAG: hypothetical protein A2786_05455 [Candidatus Chisholmbacteria bacterium RIFCSPHIGHO2_01_FULL_52_32]OGY19722.1 MAG: hypothetical protein A2900_01285 [Candidatus Chisholmbacteria bacterium RIFCSPLOWO2_01_FULL_50_28]